MSNMLKNCLCGLIIVAFILIIICIIGFLLSLPARYTCYATAKKMNVEHNYSMITDCMIKVKGQYILLDNYRIIQS